MGIIWSRFKKKVSTKEKLQKLQEEINNLEEYKEHTEQRRKKLVGSLIASSIFFFFLAAVICYFYYLPPTLEERLLYATSFAGFYILVYFIKSVVTCYYRWKVTRNENKLLSLKTKKEEILDQVMETETYKVATEILEIFAPEQIRRATLALKTPATSVVTGHRIPLSQSGDVRRRTISPQSSQNFGTRPSPTNLRPSGPSASYGYARSSMTPRPQQLVLRPNVSTPSQSSLQGPRSMYPSVSPMSSRAYGRSESGSLHTSNSNMGDPPGPPMPRPILPRERGMLDRFVEYLVGDGPSNRYALVCRQCESHNGMALKEEFPYIAFRCAYCFYWNPARKQKPAPPRLDSLPQRVTAEMSRRVMEKEEAEESSSSEEEETETDSSSTSNPSSDDGEDEEVNSFTNRSFVHEKGDKECKEEGKLQNLSSAEEDKIIADHPPSEPESKMPESTPLPTECCSSSVVTDDDPSLPSAETAETSHEAL